MAGSMGVYVPAVAVQRALAAGRVFLFIHLLSKTQYGLWGLSSMIFVVGAPMVTLGTHLGLARYVSFYEARGLLNQFYRRMRRTIPAIALLITIIGFIASEQITSLLIVSRAPETAAPLKQQLRICWMALVNAMLMALYHNLRSFMIGMRVYRMVSTVEICYTVLFTVLAVGGLVLAPAALTVLVTHAGALGLAILIGLALLRAGVRETTLAAGVQAPGIDAAEAHVLEPSAETVELTAEAPLGPAPEERPPAAEDALRRVLQFGLVALLGSMLWLGTGYVSFWMTSHKLGQSIAGGFFAFLQIGQLVLFLANAAYAVVFTHVARRWEAGDRETAMFTLQTAYKAVAITVMTLTLLIYATSGLWIHLLPAAYRESLPLLGGLLMFFQALTHLGLTTILVKIHRRPIIIALLALAGGGANALLAWWWLPIYGPVGAAWAAGVGMYAGAGAVTLVYLFAARVKLYPGTLFVLASPGLLLLLLSHTWWWTAAAIWAVILGVGIATPWVFSKREKMILTPYIVRAGRVLRRTRK